MRFKKGDVFTIKDSSGKSRFFQYAQVDRYQLGSHVVRVFDDRLSGMPNCESVMEADVEFWCHVFLPIGIRMEVWERIGHCKLSKSIELPRFRTSGHYGTGANTSDLWSVWSLGEEVETVQYLDDDQCNYWIGTVFTPLNMQKFMDSGFIVPMYPKPERNPGPV